MLTENFSTHTTKKIAKPVLNLDRTQLIFEASGQEEMTCQITSWPYAGDVIHFNINMVGTSLQKNIQEFLIALQEKAGLLTNTKSSSELKTNRRKNGKKKKCLGAQIKI